MPSPRLPIKRPARDRFRRGGTPSAEGTCNPLVEVVAFREERRVSRCIRWNDPLHCRSDFPQRETLVVMFSSASEPGDATDGPSSERSQPAASADGRRNGEFFERVLAETRSLLDGGAVPSGAEIEVLRGVATRYCGRELAADPIVVELVQAVLKLRFPRHWRHDALWTGMAQRIATTLADDAPSWHRLCLFWDRLCEAAR